ncbi:acyltransferase family protein [Paraburkholderia silviterrae]|uniref:Acyltransferase n=1 Tax=Paraburkholderia silviterrae TaxID=2528715 RepID=A0A4V2ZYJ8_9BURK|nr:acyltransferase [Paraburkholderia silviterrae]TDG20824.1 acyltransferase [Paraburkholderia silviterrae]
MSQLKYESRENSFGFLRLLFASLVILSHTPEIYDGNRNREILTNIFGSISFGELAVDGFFLISGYLISASYLKTQSPVSFLKKRIFRIYPAFAASYLICDLVVAPLGGGDVAVTPQHVLSLAARILLLQPPMSTTAFHGTYYPDLNGAMWTIPYEFRCYLLILALGLLGFFNRKRVILITAISFLVLSCIIPEHYHPFGYEAALAQTQAHSFWDRIFNLTVGEPRSTIRFVGVFLCGSTYQIYKDRISFDKKWTAAFSAAALVTFLFEPRTANLAVAIFGGYLVIAISNLGKQYVTCKINSENDISYGVYLYAWPAAKLILWYRPDMNIVLVGMLTLISAVIMGTVSWHLLEKPIMHKIQRKAPSNPAVIA